MSQQDSLFEGSSSNSHGMGQSKSSRRRRRKRKSKSEGDHGEQAASTGGEQANSTGEPVAIQAASAPRTENAPRQNFQANAGQQQNNNGGAASTGKRWKKKFRDRQRSGGSFENNGGSQNAGSSNQNGHSNGGGFRSADTHQFGNNAGASSKRKGGFSNGGGGKQQRGPRSFVGPMDHSYRVVNGNFADAPPSTIESHANGNYQGRSHSPRQSYQSDSQPIDYSQGRAIPIAEDAPTKIVFFIEDLFFLAKISETARKLGVKVAFMKNEKEAIATLTSAEEADRPGLIVFDLNNANAKPLTLIPKLKAKLKKSTSIIGFLSHLQGDLKAKAVEAGCDTVMPRSAFSQNLPNLLRRYGIVEEEEANFNM
ncbi:helicase [Granulicella sibirica]|uniref:Helicase n=2 Tax=Granulicella sibirica TaxID=2479048 RepID=A0A4V1L6B7_9BACT|nr:helicase [Granulicella sibirica]